MAETQNPADRGSFGAVLDRRKQSSAVTTSTTDHGTKSPMLKKAKQGEMPSFPGDYELLKLDLTSPNREGKIDLRLNWSDFNIYEDMFANCMVGSITLTDGVGLREHVPIIGEETIHIHLRTRGFKKQRQDSVNPGPFLGSEPDGIINIKFRVYRVDGIQELSEGLVMFTLHLISEEYIINAQRKVRKAWEFPVRISRMVKELYAQIFKRGRPLAKKLFIEPTLNLTNLIIPNYQPFQAFNFLASRAVSSGKHAAGSSFVFFETVKGFHFISIETLMSGGGIGYRAAEGAEEGAEMVYTAPENPVKEVYTIQPKGLHTHNDPNRDTAVEMISVSAYEFTSNFDIVENLQAGMYANRLLTHDLVRMKYDTLDFNYVQAENLEQKVEKDPSSGATSVTEYKQQAADAKKFSDDFSHLGKGKLCSVDQDALGFPDGHICFYPTNFAHEVRFKEDIGSMGVHGAPKGNLNIISNRVEQWMQSGLVQQQELENIKVSIRAPGMSSRCVGDLIEFKLPTTDTTDRDTETAATPHKYYSGYYLITKVRHHFTNDKYEIEFEAVKDSLHTSVSSDASSADTARITPTSQEQTAASLGPR
jgi:hypothetical protein